MGGHSYACRSTVSEPIHNQPVNQPRKHPIRMVSVRGTFTWFAERQWPVCVPQKIDFSYRGCFKYRLKAFIWRNILNRSVNEKIREKR